MRIADGAAEAVGHRAMLGVVVAVRRSTSLRLDAVAALAALAAHAPKKQAVESILKKVLTEDKSPEVVRSAMRAKAEISGDSVPMTA